MLRNAIYARFTTSEWDTSNKAHFNLSEKERGLAERLRTDSWRTVKAIDTQTRNRQASNAKKLSKKLKKTIFTLYNVSSPLKLFVRLYHEHWRHWRAYGIAGKADGKGATLRGQILLLGVYSA